jgi:hypothetical protein
MGRFNKEKEKFWREQVALAEKHDGSLQSYCRSKGISIAKMGYWRSKFQKASNTRALVPAKFIPVEIAAGPTARLPDPRWLAEFILSLDRGCR